MIAAPPAIMPVRAMIAKVMPNSSTFCWSSRGTRKLVMITRNTNRLSTERAFSVMYPAKYSVPIWWPSEKIHSTTPNTTAMPT